jgi:hypothetical protein
VIGPRKAEPVCRIRCGDISINPLVPCPMSVYSDGKCLAGKQQLAHTCC